MRTEQTGLRKTIRIIFVSFLVLFLMPIPAKAQTVYVDICPGDTYRASVTLNKTYQYQWQVSYTPELVKDWSAYTDISGANSYYYNFSPPNYKYDYRIICEVTPFFGIPYTIGPWEFTVYNETSPTNPTTVGVTGDNYCPASAPATITLTASGGIGAGYIWNTSSTSPSGSQSISTHPSAPSSTRYYYIRTTSGNNCQPSSGVSVQAIVKTLSEAPIQILATQNNFCPGGTTTLSLDEGSLGTGAYWRWEQNGSYRGDQPTYTTPALSSSTSYTVQPYSGDCDVSVTTKLINIVVNDIPVKADGITADADEVCVDGSTILHQVGGSDGSSTTWRWYNGSCGGSPIANGDLLNTGSLTQTTTFYLRAEDDCGNTDCVSKTITVVPLSIDEQPEPQNVCVAGTTSVAVVGTGVDLQYQWKKDGSDITGATSSTYWITGATLGDAGSYSCVVSDAENSLPSDAATITVLNEPIITTQPATTTACYGETVQLEVIATVTNAATYQWRKNGVDMTGETESVLEFVNATPAVNDIYSCFIDDACGDLTTSNAVLTIRNTPPQIELGGDTLSCMNFSVELSAGLGYNSFLWSTGETTQTITVMNDEDDYFVRGTDLNGCYGYSDTVHIAFTAPYEGAEICIVTVDTLTGKNMVVWEKTEDVGIASYNVWREGSTVNDSVLVENVAFDAISVAVDEESEPELKAHRYWITAIDTCGNESGRSNIHKTMLLTTGVGPDRINLSWLEYEVQGQPYLFVGYKIYRSPISSIFNIIDSISSGSPLYPDINPPDGTNYYRIAGLIDTPCNPDDSKKAGTGPYHHSLSNLDDNKLQTGINMGNAEVQLAIYPNPFENYTTVRFYNPENSEYTLYIRDLSGKLVQTREHIKEQEIRINRGSMKPGYYFIEVIGEKMFRGKMIIQ